ncbi:DNA/RNA non-specific endonuclease [Actinosynnema sp. NPDC023658]|uniref:DNA/RNA non-specific endonuclease n=1 Tax=Actinosynnema sp. NPDC023658 TaxID=3155465 RepID=UPI0033DB9DD4
MSSERTLPDSFGGGLEGNANTGEDHKVDGDKAINREQPLSESNSNHSFQTGERSGESPSESGLDTHKHSSSSGLTQVIPENDSDRMLDQERDLSPSIIREEDDKTASSAIEPGTVGTYPVEDKGGVQVALSPAHSTGREEDNSQPSPTHQSPETTRRDVDDVEISRTDTDRSGGTASQEGAENESRTATGQSVDMTVREEPQSITPADSLSDTSVDSEQPSKQIDNYASADATNTTASTSATAHDIQRAEPSDEQAATGNHQTPASEKPPKNQVVEISPFGSESSSSSDSSTTGKHIPAVETEPVVTSRDNSNGSDTPTASEKMVREVEGGGPRRWNKELNKPNPDTVYIVTNANSGEKATYETDDRSRVIRAEGAATIPASPNPRNGYQQRVAGRGDRLQGDEGGHLFASSLGGIGEAINIVPMADQLNSTGKRRWYKMETEWRDHLNKGDKVHVEIYPKYPEDSKRPTEFEVKYTVTDAFGNATPNLMSFMNK